MGNQLIGGDDRLSVRGFFSLQSAVSPLFLIEMFRTTFLYALPPAAPPADGMNPLAPFAK